MRHWFSGQPLYTWLSLRGCIFRRWGRGGQQPEDEGRFQPDLPLRHGFHRRTLPPAQTQEEDYGEAGGGDSDGKILEGGGRERALAQDWGRRRGVPVAAAATNEVWTVREKKTKGGLWRGGEWPRGVKVFPRLWANRAIKKWPTLEEREVNKFIDHFSFGICNFNG